MFKILPSLSKFLTILLFIISTNSHTQWITWEKLYLYSNVQSFPDCGIQSNDGNYFIGGYNTFLGGFLMKLNSEGDTLWIKHYGQVTSLVETNDGNLIASLNGPNNILKLDYNGNVIWSRDFNEPGYDFIVMTYLHSTNDANFVALGYTNYPRASYLIKFDISGNKIWGKISQSYYNQIKSLPDNSFFAIGTISVQNNYQIMLSRLTESGNVIWERSYGTTFQESGYSLFQTYDKGFMLFGNTRYYPGESRIYLVRTDSSGNYLWSKFIGDTVTNYHSYGNSVLKNPFNQQYVLTGAKFPDSYYDTAKVFIMGLDSLGNEVWEKSFKNDSLDYEGLAIDLCNDSGYIISGAGDLRSWGDLSGPNYVCVFKTNKFGEINPIGIIKNSNEVPVAYKLYQNYPNPFNPSTVIRFNIPIEGNVNIMVYDILSKTVYEVNEFKKAGEYSLNFESNDISSGIYFYSLRAGVYFDTKKMVLLK